ncbi:sigma-70 family RNA polymerase sigma factor [Saccharopolyspora taberi]|uniref:Sigma-70 family RNA polymerase sigma factor n=1 Tax=Saccharopolyspora taberi TaxID=60895 RepID=A0ABN3V6D2_9PSEU
MGSRGASARGAHGVRAAEESFEQFYRDCRPRICAVLASMTDDTRYVEDAAQEALVKTRELWSRIRGYDKPEAWTIKVAVRLMRAWQARDLRQTALTEDAGSHRGPAEEAAGRLDLHAAIRRLSDGNAAAVNLHLLGYSTAEIAGILCVEVDAVKTRLSRSRKALKALLSEEE